MEVFKAFAVMSLADLVSGPMDKIRGAMKALDGKIGGLSNSMGKLALAMAPVAIAAGVLLGVFGVATAKAIAFESSMADVAKVVDFDTRAEFEAMGATILDMSGKIPMAADGIADIISAAAQSGVAKQDLAEFAEQAAKMGVAFDLTGDLAGKMMADWRAGMNLPLPRVYALADAVNHLSNNMNATAPALGEVIQRTGPLAMTAGLAEQEVAALAAAFLSAGASPEIASTALKKFVGVLTRSEAMSKRGQQAFADLGFSVTQLAKDMQTDAQGTIFKVLNALADKPKEMQMAMLTEMFGEESIGAIAPLLSNMGNLTQAFELVGDASAYAGSMQAEFDTRSKTAANALQLLKNKFTAMLIIVGNAFLPVISAVSVVLGDIFDAGRAFFASPLGQWFIKVGAGVATAVIAVTAFAAALWAAGVAGPWLAVKLAPLKAALMAVSWPVWAVIGAFAALYLAYKTNFGGIADAIDGWWNKISLVFKGVAAVVSSMTGGVGEIRGELGKDIKAAGLLGVVTNVSKLFYRAQRFVVGFVDGVKAGFGAVGAVFSRVFDRVGALLKKIGGILSGLLPSLGGGEVTSAASEWEAWGNILGVVVGWLAEGLGVVLQVIINQISNFIDVIRLVCAIFNGDWAAAGQIFSDILATMGDSILAIADLFGFGDWLRDAWQGAMDFISGINLYESGCKIISTLIEGITAKASALVDTVCGVFATIREYTPFSDAKRGPLSDLTYSGGAIMTTLASGVHTKQNSLIDSVSGAFAGAAGALSGGLGLDFAAPDASDLALPRVVIPAPDVPDAPAGQIFSDILATMGDSILAIADLFGFGDWLRDAWAEAMAFIDSIDLFESGAKIIDTLISGIKSMAGSMVESVTGVFSSVRDLLPFSDAKTGPFSALTQSGGAIMTTLATGVDTQQSSLIDSVSGAFAGAAGALSGGLGLDFAAPDASDLALPRVVIPAPDVPDAPAGYAKGQGKAGSGRDKGGATQYITISNLSLPDVTDAKGFVAALQNLVAECDGVPA